MAALGRGDAEDAARAYEEALQLVRQLKNKVGAAIALFGTAGVAILRGQWARAARLFGAAEAVRKVIGHSDPQLKQLNFDYEDAVANLRTKLGDTAFEAAFSEGQAMSIEQSIEYALSADKPDPPVVPVPEERTTALSRREREVALLIARGFTDRQIARELAISERTVTTHVGRILRKLGAKSRAQVAAWVVEQSLHP